MYVFMYLCMYVCMYVCTCRYLECHSPHCSITWYLSIVGRWDYNPWQVSLELLNSRCFLQVYMTADIWSDVGTISYMCTYD